MKKRLFISGILILLLLVSFSLVIPLMKPEDIIIYSVFAVIVLVLLLVYLFSGVAKFTVMFIYSSLIIVSLMILKDYEQPIIVIGTLAFIINPLANLESFIEKKLTDEDTAPLRISIRGKYWPFYSYRQSMKNYVRMPQTKKLYTKSWYLRVRQLSTLILLFIGIYLFINELKNIYFDLYEYNLPQIFTFYAVITLFVLTFILYKNGFTSMFRTAISFLFAPIIYAVWFSDFSFPSKIIFSGFILIIGIADILYEKYMSLSRVAYSAYQYYDPSDQRYVYANEFYEPLVYNETYNLVGIYKLGIKLKDFEQMLQQILFYSNRKHFMITAYTFNGKELMLYTEFYHKDAKKAKKFSYYLESLFEVTVDDQIIFDKNKQIYEEKFFHRNEYIVARALSLAEFLNKLEIKNNNVIISIIFSFISLEDIEDFSKFYIIDRMEDFDSDNYYAARVVAKVANNSFAIENKVREILVNSLIHRANYVRILVYYEGE